MEKSTTTSRLVIMAFLIALTVILGIFSINTPILRIGFAFLPMAIMGIKFGPWWAGIGCAMSDILRMIVFPSGAYFPGFTLTAFLTGLIFGFFLYNREITWKRVIPACLVVTIVLNFILDTIWLSILMGDGFIALLPTRIVKCVIMLPVEIILIPLVWNKLLSHIPAFKANITG